MNIRDFTNGILFLSDFARCLYFKNCIRMCDEDIKTFYISYLTCPTLLCKTQNELLDQGY